MKVGNVMSAKQLPFKRSTKAKIYKIGNFKGGVGKSTTAQMLGFESAYAKKKIP